MQVATHLDLTRPVRWKIELRRLLQNTRLLHLRRTLVSFRWLTRLLHCLSSTVLMNVALQTGDARVALSLLVLWWLLLLFSNGDGASKRVLTGGCRAVSAKRDVFHDGFTFPTATTNRMILRRWHFG